jgi:hypothetical protein
LNINPGGPSQRFVIVGPSVRISLGKEKGFEVGPSSPCFAPSGKMIGDPDGSKLTEGISDSHHFPRTFVISSYREPASLKESWFP